MPHVVFVFLDGIGLGPPGDDNPFSTIDLPGLAKWTDGQAWTSDADSIDRPRHILRPVDATLGIEGLPQSGTGQASLFSGVNASALAGRHFGPYPHSETKEMLAERNLWQQIQRIGSNGSKPTAFANAYPEVFFEHREATGRWTVTTFCCINANVRLRRYEDWQNRQAITADLTGTTWKTELGYGLDPITESDAADRLTAIAGDYVLTVFEYYLTDKAGHSQSSRHARRVLRSLDRFLGALQERVDPEQHLVVISSDHGNLEDLSTSSHTRHPVPLIGYGRGAKNFADARSIVDVTPSIVSAVAADTSEQ